MTDFEKRMHEGMKVLWTTWEAIKMASELRDISDTLKNELEKLRIKRVKKK